MNLKFELVNVSRGGKCSGCGYTINPGITIQRQGKKICRLCSTKVLIEARNDLNVIERKLFGVGGA